MYKTIQIIFIGLTAAFLLTACGSEDRDAKKLGFINASEMKSLQAQGFKTKEEYEVAEAKKFGFKDFAEMKTIQAMGFNTKIEYEDAEAKKLGFDSSNEKNAINREGFSTKQDYLEAQENAQKEGWHSLEEKKQAGRINNPKEYRAQLAREEREKARAEERGKQAESLARIEKDRERYCYVYNNAKQDCATAANINQCIDIKLPSWAAAGKYNYACY